MKSSTNVLLAWLVTGVLVEAGLVFGLAVNFQLVVSCALLSIVHLLLRQSARGCQLKSDGRREWLPLWGTLFAAAVSALALITVPRGVVHVLASGPDNGSWLFVSSQFADQRPIWSGHGGPMTVAIAFATGVGRLAALLVGASPSSVIVPIGAVSFLTVLSVVGAILLCCRSAHGSASRFAMTAAVFCGAVLFLDFGHLSAWFVLLLLTTFFVQYPTAVSEGRIALLWIAVLSFLLWLPLKPLSALGALGVLGLMVGKRRALGISRGLVVIDAMVIIPALLISSQSLLAHVTAFGGFATGLFSISAGGLLRGAADYLDLSGGTHSLSLLVSLVVFALVALGVRRSKPSAPAAIALGLLAWALGLRLLDEVVNGGSGYGSQKLLLLVTLVALVSISASDARIPKLTSLASVAVLVGSTISVVNFHSAADSATVHWQGDSWEGVVEDGLKDELGALPKACLTDATWDRFDSPVTDDLSVRSAYTCTRFLGSMAGRGDLPNDLLEFNVGHESWGWVASRVSASSFLRDDVLVLDSSREPYRRTRLIDFVSESASLPEMAVLTMSRIPDAVLEAAPPHSIDDVDLQNGVVKGWASRSISALVMVSEQLGNSSLPAVRRSPRPDVELVLGPRELASGFVVDVAGEKLSSSCFLVMDVEGRVFRAVRPFGCWPP